LYTPTGNYPLAATPHIIDCYAQLAEDNKPANFAYEKLTTLKSKKNYENKSLK